MPDPRRAWLALLGAAALALAISPALASASAAGEYTESIPDASGDTPTNDLINGGGGDGGSTSDDGAVPSGGGGGSEAAAVVPLTKTDRKLAEKGSAGQALLDLVGSSGADDGKVEETAGAGEQSVGSRLLNGSGGGGGMGALLYLMLGATALWAIASAAARRRHGPVLS